MKNLPTDHAAPLSILAVCKPGQVSSRQFTTSSAANALLLAFGEGESVSEETYPGDTLYLGVEGAALVSLPDRDERVPAGSALMVPAGVPHAVSGEGAFKIFQLNVNE